MGWKQRVMDKKQRQDEQANEKTSPPRWPAPAASSLHINCGIWFFSRHLLSFIYLFGDVFSLGRWIILSVFPLPLRQMNRVISRLKRELAPDRGVPAHLCRAGAPPCLAFPLCLSPATLELGGPPGCTGLRVQGQALGPTVCVTLGKPFKLSEP